MENRHRILSPNFLTSAVSTRTHSSEEANKWDSLILASVSRVRASLPAVQRRDANARFSLLRKAHPLLLGQAAPATAPRRAGLPGVEAIHFDQLPRSRAVSSSRRAPMSTSLFVRSSVGDIDAHAEEPEPC